MPDGRNEFRDTLADRFDGSVLGGHDVRVALAVDGWRPLVCSISAAGLAFDDTVVPEAAFYFDSAQTALGLLCGDADVMDAFMEERFRSDGSITLVFVLLSVFRGIPLDVPP